MIEVTHELEQKQDMRWVLTSLKLWPFLWKFLARSILGSTFGEPLETGLADLAQPELLLDFEVVTLKILDACKD